MSRLWLRLYQRVGNRSYYAAAERTLRFILSTQDLNTLDPNIRGAVAGSFPIYGRYERFKYPNWAAKFLVDALLTWRQTAGGDPVMSYAG